MRSFILIILLLSLFSCKSKKEQVLDFGRFKLTTPGDWYKFDRGEDDFGSLTNGQDTLSYYYGYGDMYVDEYMRNCLIANDTVNGLFAEIAIPNNPNTEFYSLYIPQLYNANFKFRLCGFYIHDKAVALSIFKSLVFRESDTTVNPKLSANKFLHRLSAVSIFHQSCASCHDKNFHNAASNPAGPGLRTALGGEDAEWVYKFLTTPGEVKSDPYHEALKNAYKPSACIKYPALTREEANAIYQCFH